MFVLSMHYSGLLFEISQLMSQPLSIRWLNSNSPARYGRPSHAGPGPVHRPHPWSLCHAGAARARAEGGGDGDGTGGHHHEAHPEVPAAAV